jgi:hypothetical protein
MNLEQNLYILSDTITPISALAAVEVLRVSAVLKEASRDREVERC